MQERKSNTMRTAETRRALIKAGRSLFAEQGFQETSTPDIVAKAGVTRGALYHHFADKQALFQAVLEAEGELIASEIDDGSKGAKSPLESLRQGARAYFKALSDPARARLMLVDGPAILGPQEMRRVDLKTGGEELRAGLAEALGSEMPDDAIEARADLISAMFDRAALARANGSPADVYERAMDALLVAIVAAPLPSA